MKEQFSAYIFFIWKNNLVSTLFIYLFLNMCKKKPGRANDG